MRLLLCCGDVLLWRKGEHERGELTDLTGYPFNQLALQTLLRRVLRGLITFGSFHESRDSILTRRKFFAPTVCTVACRRQPMNQRCPIRIRFVSSCFSVCSWWTRTTSRSLRRESTSLRDASHSDGVGAGKRLPTILFYRAQRARPALCFEFLTCRRRRFRAPWLQPPLAETSEGFLYLRTKAGRADRI